MVAGTSVPLPGVLTAGRGELSVLATGSAAAAGGGSGAPRSAACGVPGVTRAPWLFFLRNDDVRSHGMNVERRLIALMKGWLAGVKVRVPIEERDDSKSGTKGQDRGGGG